MLEVEDYELFHRFIRSTLGKRPELRMVAEVADGLEAVNKTEELQPDLILLDVGLPTLTGIEAARQIRKLSPKSKMLFVSQNPRSTWYRKPIARAHGATSSKHTLESNY